MSHISWNEYKKRRAMNHKIQGQLTLNVGEGVATFKEEFYKIPVGAFISAIVRDNTNQITIFWVKE